ncbi:hypothetical protein [Aeromicrobium stalagmiti]|uniref:hypothetical protein n=1 Tax=Aeromicrobium stalagmiti TaxID=2738988 RepID=UPI001567E8AE|nr:hypothetical protein [Aeromicrobium stalagmiti]NRQ51566.1 hypothetical protein [Aeromicrobium stalagmiti]
MTLPDLRNSMLAMTCQCDDGPIDCLKSDQPVTQFVPGDDQFRCQPRSDREVGLSLQKGTLSTTGARDAMLGKARSSKPKTGSRVRYSTVGTLRDNGFEVIHTPRKIANGTHVSVVWPNTNSVYDAFVPWPEDVTQTFNECFDEPTDPVDAGGAE